MIERELSWRSPYAAFAPLAGEAYAHLLHGGEMRLGGWSIIVAEPVDILTLADHDGDAWLYEVERLCNARRRRAPVASRAPFASGLVGYVGYEALAGLEPSLCLPASPYGLAGAELGAYDAAAVFSRADERACILGRSERAVRRLEERLGRTEPEAPVLPPFSRLESNFSKAGYELAIADVIERIRNGDFFQANVAQTLTVHALRDFSAFDLLRVMAAESDAFFASLFQYKEGMVVSNSPERFFSLTPDGRLYAEPIKGTRPRGDGPARDESLAKALLADPKDRAENIMIADLMRNDLSRICDDHSVREEAICELMSVTRVHHLVSRISGQLREGLGVADVFRALFPSGSITGAPKIEAMKAIARIEGQGRGPYCGAFGYIDDSGAADFAVAIRTMMIDERARSISIPVGGGVTLRSDPASEYNETLVKASAALAALSLSAEDL